MTPMTQFISDLLGIINAVRQEGLTDAEFKATMRGCLMTVRHDPVFTDEQKLIAELILLDAKR